MKINQRIVEIASYYGISKASKFAEKTGFSHQVSTNYLKGRQKPSVDALEKIQLIFEEISPEWLLMGRGPMLRDGIPLPPAADDSKSDASDLRAALDTLREQLKVKDEQIKVKDEQINKLIDKID